MLVCAGLIGLATASLTTIAASVASRDARSMSRLDVSMLLYLRLFVSICEQDCRILKLPTMLSEGGLDGGLVLNDAIRKRRNQAHAGAGDPWIKIFDELLAHHGLKAFHEHAGFDECRNARLDGGDGDRLCFAKIVARRGH